MSCAIWSRRFTPTAAARSTSRSAKAPARGTGETNRRPSFSARGVVRPAAANRDRIFNPRFLSLCLARHKEKPLQLFGHEPHVIDGGRRRCRSRARRACSRPLRTQLRFKESRENKCFCLERHGPEMRKETPKLSCRACCGGAK